MAETVDGFICADWHNNNFANNRYTKENYPNAGLEDGNYCRNPDSDDAPWCLHEYNQSIREPNWGYCDVGVSSDACDYVDGKCNINLVENQNVKEYKKTAVLYQINFETKYGVSVVRYYVKT